MANEVLIKAKTAIVIADTTDWPVGGNYGWGDDTKQIDLTSIATTAARQSDKVDLGLGGTAYKAKRYAVFMAIEMDVAAVAGTTVDLYAGFSASATAATGNPAGLTGADAAYAGVISLATSLPQLERIGAMIMTASIATTPQLQFIGYFVAPERYACFVVVNNTAQAFEGDAVQMAIYIVPEVDEVQ